MTFTAGSLDYAYLEDALQRFLYSDGLICSLSKWESASFFQIWAALSLASFVSLTSISGICFYVLYVCPTYDMWRYKINPRYPTAEKVREEIIVMAQGLLFSTICPALSLYFTKHRRGYGYCGADGQSNGGVAWLLTSFLLIWFTTDFYEWLYHWLGHSTAFMWKLHKGHHCFYNPTPFAVIADNPIDQFFRSAPLLFFPMLMPVNIDLLFGMFSLLFFFNGLVQHAGYEFYHLEYYLGIDGHSSWFLTSYHHYLHHAKSSINTPLYNGQLLQLWDHLAGSATYISPALRSSKPSSKKPSAKDVQKSCLCSKCAREKGLRTAEEWQRTLASKPNYAELCSVQFWLQYPASGSDDGMSKDD